MGIFSRLFKLGKAKAEAGVDKLEDGARFDLLRSKVRELEDSLQKSVEGLAKVKAVQIKFRKEAEKRKREAEEQKSKAVKLRDKLNTAEDETTQTELKGYIVTCLNQHENLLAESKAQEANAEKQGQIVTNLEVKIKDLKELIQTTKNNITNKEASAQAADINKNVSKELSSMNVDGVTSQIDEINKRIDSDNAEAEAWTSIDASTESDQEKIDRLLNESSSTEDSVLLNDFLNEGK